MGVARQTVERVLAFNNQKNWPAVEASYVPEAEIILPRDTRVTLKELGNIVRGVWERFPDWHYEIDFSRVVEEGLTAAYEGVEGGTSKDGNIVRIPVAIFVTVTPDGKIRRMAGYW